MIIFPFMYRVPRALAPVVCVPGLVFEALLRARSRLYASGVFLKRKLDGPVISIGNITLGGSGKTPLVIHVAEILSKLGFTPVVLSRGYGRTDPRKAYVVPPGLDLPDPASKLGDEPALIRRRIPQIWLGISRDRFAVGRRIGQPGQRLAFILDDGFQHQRLYRDLDIVVVDPSQPLLSNRVFPRGTLREPPSALRRCHVIVVNSMRPHVGMHGIEAELQSLHLRAFIVYCEQKIQAVVPFDAWLRFEGRNGCSAGVQSAYLVAALGNPVRFLDDVRNLKIEVRGMRFFSDHCRIGQNDWNACANEARATGADAILTTEKDAVKISRPPDFPLLVSVQTTRIAESTEFERILKNCLERRP